MPSNETLIVFTLAALVLNISPGPSNFYIMSRSVSQGTRAGLLSVLGLATGATVHVLATTFGVSAIILASATVFSVVKFAGALYLIYLGVQCIQCAKSTATLETPAPKTARKIFTESVMVEVLNPKTALFYLAFLPQFVDPAIGPVIPQFLILGAIATLSAIPCDSVVAYLSGSLAKAINRNPGVQQMQNWVSGSILIFLGVFLAASRQAD
jgi:threonine/homoserine/homoserine lactone efflux protein